MTSEFDALSYQCPDDWMMYASGDKPGWGTCWASVEHVSTLNITHFEKSSTLNITNISYSFLEVVSPVCSWESRRTLDHMSCGFDEAKCLHL